MNSFFKNKKTINILSLLYVILSLFIVYLNAFLFVFHSSNFFPIINAIVTALGLFAFKGRIRLYLLTVLIPASKLMMLKDTRIGSFFTWIIALYFVVCFVERIFKKRSFSSEEFLLITVYLFLFIFTFLTNLANWNISHIFKSLSYLLYFAIPMLFFVDCSANKNVLTISLCFLAGHLLTNLFSYYFIYLSNYPALFLSTYIPNYLPIFQAQGISAFRFMGLKGDSNHNSLYVLLASILLILNVENKSYKVKIPCYLLCGVSQIFGFLGGSKTYFIGFIINY